MIAPPDRAAWRSRGLLLALLFAIAVAIIGIWVVVFIRRGYADVTELVWSPALAVGFTMVGALIVSRRPGNVIGRICLATGLVLGVQLAIVAIVAIADVAPGRLPAVLIVGANLTAYLQWFGLVGIVVILARFPDGRLPGVHWRIIDALIVVFAVLQALQLWRPGEVPISWILISANPIAIVSLPVEVFDLAAEWAPRFLSLAALLSLAASLVTYRRSSPRVRVQIRWVLSAAAAAASGMAILFVSNWTDPLATVAFILVVVSPLLIPVGIGIAILRYRLYEIDQIVSRTIGYGAVTGVLGVVFVGTNLVLQAALAPLVRADTLVVAGSTLLVAALFSPVRARIQRTVDRRFHRARFDAERLAAAFADHLRDEVDLNTLRERSVAVAASAVEPDRIALWLRAGRGAG